MNLTDHQWQIVSPVLGSDPVRSDRRGRPWSNQRAVFNGILWVMWAETPWRALPSIFPPFTTVHRRMCQWQQNGRMSQALAALAEDLLHREGSEPHPCPTDPSDPDCLRQDEQGRTFPFPANSTGDLAKALISPLATSLMRNHQIQARLEHSLYAHA